MAYWVWSRYTAVFASRPPLYHWRSCSFSQPQAISVIHKHKYTVAVRTEVIENMLRFKFINFNLTVKLKLINFKTFNVTNI